MTEQVLTAVEFAELDVPGRHDLVDGQLWSMPPAKIPHGRCTARLVASLATSGGDGDLFAAELGFVLSEDQRTIICPDVSYVRNDRIPDANEKGFFPGAPDLAIEVISDSERPSRVQTKVALYLAAGTSIVWCVYPDLRQVVVYRNDGPPLIVGITDTLDAEPVIPGFALPLAELFR